MEGREGRGKVELDFGFAKVRKVRGSFVLRTHLEVEDVDDSICQNNARGQQGPLRVNTRRCRKKSRLTNMRHLRPRLPNSLLVFHLSSSLPDLHLLQLLRIQLPNMIRRVEVVLESEGRVDGSEEGGHVSS